MKERVKRTMKKVVTLALAATMIVAAVPAKKSDAKVNIKYGTFSYAYNKGKAVWMIDLKKASKNKVKIGIVWSDNKKAFSTGKYITKKIKSKVSFNVKGKYQGSKKTKTIKGSITFKGKKLKCVINGKKFTAKYVPDKPVREEPEQDVWVTETDPTIQEGVREKFDIINKADNGTTFIPLATFATMLTSEGTTKWRVFAKETNNMPGGRSYYTILEITEYPDASVAVTRQYTTMLDGLDAGTEGGWSLCESPVLDSSLSPKQNDLASQLMAGEDDGVSIIPLAQIAKKVVAGDSYLIACERKAVAPNANPMYFFITATVGLDGTVTVDKDSVVNVCMDDPSDDSRKSWENIIINGVELEVKDVWISYMGNSNGKKWYNFGAVFANATSEDIEVDLSKFSFKTATATGGLSWRSWSIPKNKTYVQWATTAINEDFLSKINIGDAVEISYDGKVIGNTQIQDHSN